MRQVLTQLFGKRMNNLDSIAITDSKNLHQTVHNLKSVSDRDRSLVGTFAEIKEKMCLDNAAKELRHLPAQHQISDVLTKKGGAGAKLMQILRTGKYILPGGWSVRQNTGVFSRTWLDLNRHLQGQAAENHTYWAALALPPGNHQ